VEHPIFASLYTFNTHESRLKFVSAQVMVKETGLNSAYPLPNLIPLKIWERQLVFRAQYLCFNYRSNHYIRHRG